jgi:hypothetical protein
MATKKKPNARRGRPRRDYSDDPDLEVAAWAIALQGAWGLSERMAIDLALAICRGEAVPPTKVPRGAKKIGGLLTGYALPMERQFRSRNADIRRKLKAGKLRPDPMATVKVARLLFKVQQIARSVGKQPDLMTTIAIARLLDEL